MDLSIIRTDYSFTLSTLDSIGEEIADVFYNIEVKPKNSEYMEIGQQVDALYLLNIFSEKEENFLLITGADLFLDNFPCFGVSLFSLEKRIQAIISNSRLSETFYDKEFDYDSLISRIEKEALHELGHSHGLPHHITESKTKNNLLCPMTTKSLGNEKSYLEQVIDKRDKIFCNDCENHLKKFYENAL